jgi:hypothetical protein
VKKDLNMQPTLTRVRMYLAKYLRHAPGEPGLTFRPGGWVGAGGRPAGRLSEARLPGTGGDMPKKPPDDVSIGKFDILATYTYAKALLDGQDDNEAKQKGMVAAVMGAKAKLGHTGGSHQEDFKADKEAAEKKKKTTITAEPFDKQVADKMGGFFDDVFLPTMKKLVEAGLSYDEVKRVVKITSTWGAKISGKQFRERASKFEPK